MFGFLKKLLGGTNSVQSVSAQEAQQLVKGGAVLLDVREAGERKTMSIPGSKHLPLSQLSSKATSLPKDKTIICQCASGRRSELAARQLSEAGFDVRNLKGGITAWRMAGLPTK